MIVAPLKTVSVVVIELEPCFKDPLDGRVPIM